MQDISHYRNFSVEDYKEDPQNIIIPESEGESDVVGPLLQAVDVSKPLKVKEVNISMEAQLKMAKIGDY